MKKQSKKQKEVRAKFLEMIKAKNEKKGLLKDKKDKKACADKK